MRELTKSMFRLSWAMSMLGVRQMSRMMGPEAQGRGEAYSLDAVSTVAEDQLDGVSQSVYRAGTEFSDGMVEALGSLTSGGWSNPVGNLSQAMKDTWEAVDRSLAELRPSGDNSRL